MSALNTRKRKLKKRSNKNRLFGGASLNDPSPPTDEGQELVSMTSSGLPNPSPAAIPNRGPQPIIQLKGFNESLKIPPLEPTAPALDSVAFCNAIGKTKDTINKPFNIPSQFPNITKSPPTKKNLQGGKKRNTSKTKMVRHMHKRK
jgi:hypothetical protein